MDADQVHALLQNPDRLRAATNQDIDLEEIGMAQYYCVECAQYFAESTSLAGHKRGSKHRKRVKVGIAHENTDHRFSRRHRIHKKRLKWLLV